jgi:hypothetical protein
VWFWSGQDRSVKAVIWADATRDELTSTFYVDNAVATQTQSGVSNAYYMDPNGRARNDHRRQKGYHPLR